jgi:cytochrome c-type biogenesis protein
VSVADAFVDTVLSGPVLLALPVAAAAGLVSFLSPCVLPLVPGYLSYVTGLSGAELGDGRPTPVGDLLVRPTTQARGRVLAGSVLFVLGFSAVFVTTGALFGGLGGALVVHKAVVDRVLGALTVLLGLSFLGLVPGMQRELRVHRLPDAGLAGAPLLGVLFGVGWTPCLGPTLGAVQTLAYTQASAGRGALLTAAYCLGLGLPFVATGLAMRRALGAFEVVKRHYGLVMKVGGGLLVVVGLLLVSGLWARIVLEMQVLVSGFETAV